MEWCFCVWRHQPCFAAVAAYLTALRCEAHMRSTSWCFGVPLFALRPALVASACRGCLCFVKTLCQPILT